MAVQLAYVKDMSKQEWLLARKNGIGGSDASAILGLNPYKSMLEVYMDKTSPIITKEELEQTESQYWGTVMEDIVAQEFAKRTGYKVRRNNFILQHPDHPFMIADLDRKIVGANAGLECKTANEYMKEEWEEGVPEYYVAQVQHYMAVTGYEVFYVAVLLGGNKFKNYYIERDEEYIVELIKKEEEFWHCVETDTLPEPDGSKATEEYLARIYSAGVPVEVGLPDEIDLLLFDREELKQEVKELENKIRTIENKVKAALQENEKGFTNNWRINWTTINSNRFNSKKLKEDEPEIYERYATKSSYRRFSVNKKKNKKE